MLLRAVSPALAAYQVNRPGRILFDREARKSVLGTLLPAQRQALCGQPKERWPSHPVVKTVNARDDGGPDDRSEPFAWTVMNEAAVAYGLDDAYARRSLVRLLDRWARSGGLTRLNESEVNVYYAVDRSLLPTLVAWSLVRDAPDVERERAQRIDRWLRRVARLRGDLRPRSSEGDLTSRNNHRYLSASVSMAWGALMGEDSYFREGFRAFEAALGDMRADGSLPLETERGARALWYQRHAIASLVTIAEIGAAQGYDLYGLEENGRSLHTAVRFLLDAVDNPALVEAYAAADYKPGTAQDPEDQDLSFLEARGHGRHYMAWSELYMARFPDREESRRLLALLERKDPDFRPMIDDYSGGNTTCFVARPEGPYANGAGETPAPPANANSNAAQRE
jgi:poly(beta-D-mannuronate) lyase